MEMIPSQQSTSPLRLLLPQSWWPREEWKRPEPNIFWNTWDSPPLPPPNSIIKILKVTARVMGNIAFAEIGMTVHTEEGNSCTWPCPPQHWVNLRLLAEECWQTDICEVGNKGFPEERWQTDICEVGNKGFAEECWQTDICEVGNKGFAEECWQTDICEVGNKGFAEECWQHLWGGEQSRQTDSLGSLGPGGAESSGTLSMRTIILRSNSDWLLNIADGRSGKWSKFITWILPMTAIMAKTHPHILSPFTGYKTWWRWRWRRCLFLHSAPRMQNSALIIWPTGCHPHYADSVVSLLIQSCSWSIITTIIKTPLVCLSLLQESPTHCF